MTLSCHPTNKKLIRLLHSKKTAWSLNFERIAFLTLIRDRLIWLWNWNWSMVVITIHTIPKKLKRAQEKSKDAAEAVETQEEEEDAPVSLVTQVTYNLHTIFLIVYVHINIQQLSNINGLFALNFFFWQLQRSHIRIQGNFAPHREWTRRRSRSSYGHTLLRYLLSKEKESAE